MNRGEVLFRRQFEFESGATANKLLIKLNNPSEKDPILVVLTTSKSKWRKANPGCHSKDNYFFIEKDKDIFNEPTWILFEAITAVEQMEFLKWGLSERNLESKGCLKEVTINAIINCMKQSLDIPLEYIELLK